MSMLKYIHDYSILLHNRAKHIKSKYDVQMKTLKEVDEKIYLEWTGLSIKKCISSIITSCYIHQCLSIIVSLPCYNPHIMIFLKPKVVSALARRLLNLLNFRRLLNLLNFYFYILFYDGHRKASVDHVASCDVPM